MKTDLERNLRNALATIDMEISDNENKGLYCGKIILHVNHSVVAEAIQQKISNDNEYRIIGNPELEMTIQDGLKMTFDYEKRVNDSCMYNLLKSVK